MEDSDIIDANSDTTAEENSVGSQEIEPVSALERPLKRNAKGQFVAGTGSRGHLGGRPRGARDKITTQMIALAQQTIEEHGQAMWEKLAKDDPTACLALISRLLPNKDLSAAIDGESEGGNEITQVSINLVPAPTPRKIEGRTEQEISDQQRGLNSPVERIKHEPEAATDVVADQVTAEADEAAEAEKERVARQNEAIRAHGGLTGVPSRASRTSDAIEYPDDESWV